MPASEARADAAAWLERLRAAFPEWGFLYDPLANAWIAVRGRTDIVRAATPLELHTALETTTAPH